MPVVNSDANTLSTRSKGPSLTLCAGSLVHRERLDPRVSLLLIVLTAYYCHRMALPYCELPFIRAFVLLRSPLALSSDSLT